MDYKKIILNYEKIFYIASTLTFSFTFLFAFFNDGYAIITINHYGEAVWELPLVIFGLLCMIIAPIIRKNET